MKLTLLLAACTAARSLAEVSPDGASDMCLLQRGLEMRVLEAKANGTRADGSCECMGWHDAYQLVNCGKGHEAEFKYPIPGPLVVLFDEGVKSEWCGQFFQNLPNEKLCLKKEMGLKDPQWCYVAPGCAGSSRLWGGGPLRTKTCERGVDPSVSDMRFEELSRWALRHKLEIGILSMFAYSSWPGPPLPDVQEFWGLPRGEGAAPLSEELRARLTRQADSGVTSFIPSPSGHPPFAVMEGKKLYVIDFSEDYKRITAAGEDIWQHRELMNSWRCIGCE